MRISAYLHLMYLGLLLGAVLTAPTAAWSIEFQKGAVHASLNGSAEVKTPVRFNLDTPKEVPSLIGTLKLEGSLGDRLSLHCEFQGGYDGAARNPDNDRVVIGFDKVYPSVDRYIQFSEAYVTVALPSTDVRLGIQKFSWGTLDQFNPTDNLSPMDLRHVMDTSYSAERKIGVPAVRITHLFSPGAVNIEAVWIPFLVPYRLPDPEDRWYPQLLQTPGEVLVALPGIPVSLPPVSIFQTNEEADLPARTFAHSEYGFRISRTFGSLDVGISYFNGYDRMPVTDASGSVISSLTFIPPSLDLSYDLHLSPVFHRIQVYGVDMARSWRMFTFRAEGAYFNGRFLNIGLNALDTIVAKFQFPSLSEISFQGQKNKLIISFPYSPEISYQKDTLSVGAGMDYQLGNHIITVQTLGEYIPDYGVEPLVYEEFEIMVILGLHARFWEDTLQIESGLVINPMERLVLSRTEATYAVTDAFSVGTNLLVLDGKDESPLGQFRKNDQIAVFFRYHF